MATYGGSLDDCGDQNSFIFEMSMVEKMRIVETLQNAFQLTNNYGPDRTQEIMGVRIIINYTSLGQVI